MMRTSMRELKTPNLELAGSKVCNSKNGVFFCWKKIKKQTPASYKYLENVGKVPVFFRQLWLFSWPTLKDGHPTAFLLMVQKSGEKTTWDVQNPVL